MNRTYIKILFIVYYYLIIIVFYNEFNNRIQEYEKDLSYYNKLKSNNFKIKKGIISCFFKGDCFQEVDRVSIELKLKEKEKMVLIKDRNTLYKVNIYFGFIFPFQLFLVYKILNFKKKYKMNINEI